jgi:hypothetical protein
MIKSAKFKIIVSFAVLLINIICTAFVYFLSIETTTLKVLGSYVAIFIVSTVVWCFPIRFYIGSLVFVVFACSFGSCMNLYQHLGFYDLFVHFLSGVLLFEGGRIIIEKINNKKKLQSNKALVGLFALFFSCSCAAFWEIYEFSCDVLINAEMQGTKLNTMGDIIAGVLGAAVSLLFQHRLDKKNDDKNFQ